MHRLSRQVNRIDEGIATLQIRIAKFDVDVAQQKRA
jgi:hypothetical protein